MPDKVHCVIGIFEAELAAAIDVAIEASIHCGSYEP
jgi:hypothetical protein